MNVDTSQVERLALDWSKEGRASQLRILKEQTAIAYDFVRYVKTQKLQGQVLFQRTGQLSTHITQKTGVEDNTVVSYMGVFSGVPYAAVHEYGYKGTVTVHSRKGTEFTRNVNMPERSYLRSSLAENRAEYSLRLVQKILEHKA